MAFAPCMAHQSMQGHRPCAPSEVTPSKALFLLTFIVHFSINRRGWKRWSLDSLPALRFCNSICWSSNRILPRRNYKSVYLCNKTMKLSLGSWMLRPGWTKYIRPDSQGENGSRTRSWEGLCVSQCLPFRASKINQGPCGHVWVLGRCDARPTGFGQGWGPACMVWNLDQTSSVHFYPFELLNLEQSFIWNISVQSPNCWGSKALFSSPLYLNSCQKWTRPVHCRFPRLQL